MGSLGKYCRVIILILAFIVLAEWVEPVPSGQSIGTTQPASPALVSPIVQADPSYYVQIYPIRDHRIGEPVSITGITNIPDGEPIHLLIYSDELHPAASQRITMNFTVERPHLSEGMWEVRVDTRSFPAGKYFLEVFRETEPTVRTSDQFRILNPERLWMTIVSPGTMMTGDGFTINAETNLPAGDTIHVMITENLEKKHSDELGTWEPEGNTTVNRNTLMKNTWSYYLTAKPPAHPANYTIFACSVNYPEICSWQHFELIPAIPRPSTSSLAG